MSESGLSVDEEVLSPDIFSDDEAIANINSLSSSNASSSTSIGAVEPEPTDDVPEWKGVSMNEIRKGLGQFDFQELPPICPSANHAVLFTLPLSAHGPPKVHPTHHVDKWTQGYVRMPYSKHSIYPVDQENGTRHCRNRWEIIQESLLQSFSSTLQLEAAILSYNHIYSRRWNFSTLHNFFSEIADEDETKIFFEILLPKMVHLALQLPTLITGSIPLLKRNTNGCISLSQLQVASLLANAFFCTFPRRNSTNPQSEYANYPYINFNRLFSAFREEKRNSGKSVMEKLKCLFHYFKRVTSKAPEGTITIERRYIPKKDCPKWDYLDQKLQPLHITSKGMIETDGAGLLQVDFANKYIGGGVLGLGCVQEEIRFVICPELLVTMLVAEALDDTESLIISGVERYSSYEGYSNKFKWIGDFNDETPRDSSGRRMTSIVAIDALYFKQPLLQFNISNITRELNKAYVGFIGCEMYKNNLPAIATGNWGCGAFRGNPRLKVLLQLIAAAAVGRSMVYFTFGDTKLRDDIATMYWHFIQHNINIGHIFSLLLQYQETTLTNHSDFYHFLYNKTKTKPLTKYCIARNEDSSFKPIKPDNADNTNIWNEKVTFQSNKSLPQSCQINSKSFYNSKKNGTDAKKIEDWLVNIDENDLSNDKEEIKKSSCKDVNDIVRQNDNFEQSVTCKNEAVDDQTKTDTSAENKKKQLLWKIRDNKVSSKMFSEKRLSGLDLLDKKKTYLTNEKNDNIDDTATFDHQQTSSDSTKFTNHDEKQTLKTFSPVTTKEHPVKKNSQRKISDFFQRAL